MGASPTILYVKHGYGKAPSMYEPLIGPSAASLASAVRSLNE